MADAKFAKATSWEEMIAIHRSWMRDYNVQRHFAYEKREDGCHSPAQVMGWYKGTVYPESVLNRILFATRYTRHLNQFEYLRVQGWKLYGEAGLSGSPVTVWVYNGSITVEYQAVTLSKYRIELEEDRKQIKQVSNSHLAKTPFRSPQLTLLDVGPDSGVSTGEHPRISLGEGFITAKAWFNCRCLSLRQKEKPLEQKEPPRNSKHVPGFILCRGETQLSTFAVPTSFVLVPVGIRPNVDIASCKLVRRRGA